MKVILFTILILLNKSLLKNPIIFKQYLIIITIQIFIISIIRSNFEAFYRQLERICDFFSKNTHRVYQVHSHVPFSIFRPQQYINCQIPVEMAELNILRHIFRIKPKYPFEFVHKNH